MSSQYCSSAVLAATLLLALSMLLGSPPRAAGTDQNKPIVTRLNKDPATSLYTIAIKHGAVPLVLDLAGPLLWLACPSPHRTIPCASNECKLFASGNCPYGAAAGGQQDGGNCACAAYPYNPVDGRCSRADATTLTLAANSTDGKNPVSPVVSFRAYGSCAPGELLTSLPAGAVGVAGLSRLPLSLPSQVASKLNVAREFALCLPSGGDGAAIFGGGPFQLQAAPPVELAEGLRQNPLPLLKNPKNGAYYFRITGIAVNLEQVPVPPGAFDLDASRGTGGATLSTVTPYAALRSDIYRPLLKAFDAATSGIARATPVKPFELCYQASALTVTRLGYAVANIDLMLDGGRNWTLPGGSSMVQVSDQTVCFAFVEIGSATTPAAAADSPAVILGGFQLENHLLLFDLEKETLGFSGLLFGIRTTCSNFNFTMGSS